ncbi:hypothetical protein VOLCADRAFT_106542 [Volvox carteri f. nagariensis]|uniref:Uncharacterized protein n=1 Tax=Volvox carteri f. nagariensis TaxID=3068 RepID=D8U7X1_VOLCA|nr:uncharacterized protein VOLCADRAFT_106542 [Volvox carteri f. nagariensis]EFJ44166.1 hypothetical protein VOLCADRAFT_106542 [Volvox carteri f. nagariensis]|eukprot:XP_002954760.1 hypothetical protein VOLCADRAFT_106542 [Volvox carteri f. nagariensis]
MGLSVQQYEGLGFHTPPTAITTRATRRPDDERTPKQEAFLNDMSIMPCDWPTTISECSRLLSSRTANYEDFKKKYNEKPASALHSRGLSMDEIHKLTKSQASKLMDSHASGEQATAAQLAQLQRLNVQLLQQPLSKGDPSTLISQISVKAQAATPSQKDLLKKLTNQAGQRITDEQLDVMTLAQASTLIGGNKANGKINHYDDNLHDKGGGPSQDGAGGASASANVS